jgi:hypothetical protein
MYEALRTVADPEEDEAWESRVARKAFAEFLAKRGVQWKEGPAEGERVDRTTASKSKRESSSPR